MNDEMQRIIQELEDAISGYDKTQNDYDCNVDLLKDILSKLGVANEMRNKELEQSADYPTEVDREIRKAGKIADALYKKIKKVWEHDER